MKINWSNIPIPEGHLAVLAAGFFLQRFSSAAPFSMPLILVWIGWELAILGFAFAAWAVLEAGEQAIASRGRLLTTGPYALSQNPMYVGWHGMVLGAALGLRSAWMIVLFPLVLLYTHFKDILGEERKLAAHFEEEYQSYWGKFPGICKEDFSM